MITTGCLICKKQFNNIFELIQHIDNEHPDIRNRIIESLKEKMIL